MFPYEPYKQIFLIKFLKFDFWNCKKALILTREPFQVPPSDLVLLGNDSTHGGMKDPKVLGAGFAFAPSYAPSKSAILPWSPLTILEKSQKSQKTENF